jgi:hypothetical protein
MPTAVPCLPILAPKKNLKKYLFFLKKVLTGRGRCVTMDTTIKGGIRMKKLNKFLATYPELEWSSIKTATVHAVAGHKSGGDIHLTHWRINNFSDLATLAGQCGNSQIRIILIWDDGTQAIDVWPGEITGD